MCPDSVCLTCHTHAMHLASGAGHCASDFVFIALCAGCCVPSSICLAVCVWFCVPSRVISVMHLTQCHMSRMCVWHMCSAFCCSCVCMPGIVYSVLCAMCGVPGVVFAESVTGGVCSFMCPALQIAWCCLTLHVWPCAPRVWTWCFGLRVCAQHRVSGSVFPEFWSCCVYQVCVPSMYCSLVSPVWCSQRLGPVWGASQGVCDVCVCHLGSCT